MRTLCHMKVSTYSTLNVEPAFHNSIQTLMRTCTLARVHAHMHARTRTSDATNAQIFIILTQVLLCQPAHGQVTFM